MGSGAFLNEAAGQLAERYLELKLRQLGESIEPARYADELRRVTNSDRFDFVATHRGMFSRLGLTEAQVNTLREDHAIYMAGSGRINIAGLTMGNIDKFVNALAAVSA